jgi:primase-polymerase (primpol)-like protein
MSRPLILSALLVPVLTVGCATQGPQPTEQLTRARTLVKQADKVQAQRYAAADLQRAHDELTQAEAASGQGHYDAARDLAESAAVDADVASAKEAAGEAGHAAEEIHRSNATLAHESERADQAEASGAAPPPAPPPQTLPPPNPQN